MKAVARHAHEDCRLEALYQVKLNRGWKCGTGAPPNRADTHQACCARPHVAGRVNSQRECYMGEIAGQRAGTIVSACKPNHVVANVFVGFGVEKRPARTAAGPPVFTDIFLLCRAEILVKLFRRQLP